MDRVIHVRLDLNRTRGDERDHQLVALAEMIAARIATAALPSSAALSSATCSSAGVVPPKSLWVERFDELNLECVTSLLLGTRSLLSGQKLPCSRFEGISQEITAAQGFVGLRAILKRVSTEAPPVNSPDSRRNDKHRGSWVPASTQTSGVVEKHGGGYAAYNSNRTVPGQAALRNEFPRPLVIAAYSGAGANSISGALSSGVRQNRGCYKHPITRPVRGAYLCGIVPVRSKEGTL